MVLLVIFIYVKNTLIILYTCKMINIEDKWKENEFSGPQKLHKFIEKYNYVKIPQSKIRRFVTSTKTYQLHKPIRKRFKRRTVVVSGPNEMIDMDLLDLKNVKGQNYSKRYLLTMIDVFSRKAFACALKNKTAEHVLKCFRHILTQHPSLNPRSVRTDHGKYMY